MASQETKRRAARRPVRSTMVAIFLWNRERVGCGAPQSDCLVCGFSSPRNDRAQPRGELAPFATPAVTPPVGIDCQKYAGSKLTSRRFLRICAPGPRSEIHTCQVSWSTESRFPYKLRVPSTSPKGFRLVQAYCTSYVVENRPACEASSTVSVESYSTCRRGISDRTIFRLPTRGV